MGLILNVYRSARYEREGTDCTLAGVTAEFEQLCCVNLPGPFEPRAEAKPGLPPVGACWLGENQLGNPTVFPAALVDGEWTKAPGTWMDGGNFVASTDSRFREGVRFYGAVPVHDRDMAKERSW